mmetsp:Transcript_16428/g.24166  ORF Transcript_16428/g.24166 Transcript_16428/m.24166 type:complete len:376 (+) Transcript_16428:167-1294(+)
MNRYMRPETCVIGNSIDISTEECLSETHKELTRIISPDTAMDEPNHCGPIWSDHNNILTPEWGRRTKRTRTPIRFKTTPIECEYYGVHCSSRDISPGVCQNDAVHIRRITHRETKIDYAVKIFHLAKLSEEEITRLQEEIDILVITNHPNVVRLEEVYESDNEVYLVQELCEGGDLFEWLTSSFKREQHPDIWEEKCVNIVRQILSGVRYLHSKGIVHRDLKLENIVFESKDDNSKIKIIDFGLSKQFQPGERHDEFVGSLHSMAPEVIERNYDERCDVWSIGVITFLLLSCESPFGGCNGDQDHQVVMKRITEACYAFEPAEVWSCISNEAKKFIRALLVADATYRPTAREAKKLPWLLNPFARVIYSGSTFIL